MAGLKKTLAGIVAAVIATAGIQSSFAATTVNVLSDTGTLTTTTYAPPSSTSSNSVPSPYGSGSVSITPVLNGVKVTFNPSSGFFASANNLSGGKTSTFAGLIAFDITFDNAVSLTTNIFEDGIYSVQGANSRVGVNSTDLASGVIVSQLDNLLTPEQIGNSFKSNAIVSPLPTGPGNTFPVGANGNSGTWTLFDQVKGFSKAYKSYHVVIDNDIIAEALVNPNQAPGFAAIAKKDFSIVFTFDGSSGGGPNGTPEPASLGVLALGGLSLLARRRK